MRILVIIAGPPLTEKISGGREDLPVIADHALFRISRAVHIVRSDIEDDFRRLQRIDALIHALQQFRGREAGDPAVVNRQRETDLPVFQQLVDGEIFH